MRGTFIKALVLLPGTVLVLVPATILAVTGIDLRVAEPTLTGIFFFWAGMFCAVAGIGLAVWTMRLFLSRGRGTPAPWAPPRNLVIDGPYRHVRNPMIIGVLLILAAEALLFRSWGLALWWAVFLAGNVIYFPLVEERGLVNRFGDDYRDYMAHVPRWIPRRRAWRRDRQADEISTS